MIPPVSVSGSRLGRRRVRAVLLDVDGTLTWSGEPIPGAADTVRWLSDRRIPMRLLTNIDSRAPETVAGELARLGIEVPASAVFTPVVAALRFLEQRPEERCHLLLSAELASRFAAHDAGSGRADWVLVGDCREVGGFVELNDAFRYLLSGARLLALQRGRWWQASDGPSLDTGAFVALLEYASGQTARNFGKPSADFFRMALTDLGCAAEETVVVGDDPDSDAAGARAVGALPVLVRTGKLASQPPAAGWPDVPLVLDSIADLPGLLDPACCEEPQAGYPGGLQ